MRKIAVSILCQLLFLSLYSTAFAAELLDVKPVVAGNAVSVEISADIAMTYTYYKVPGQARAVVDIAEADPEKVEPLIVVNKGAVSSISVDKAQISGIVVSRIIFNLVSESDISVSASPDRKQLTVTFGGQTPVVANKVEPKPEPKLTAVPEPIVANAPTAPPAVVPTTNQADEDPLGLDEPTPKQKPAAEALSTQPEATPPPTRTHKLEPVVPVAVTPTRSTAPLSVKEIALGKSYIEIRTNQSVTEYKTFKLSNPDRLAIDINSDRINQKAKTVTINKFGVSKARIGISPKTIRVVIDSARIGFPEHTITSVPEGLRITFK